MPSPGDATATAPAAPAADSDAGSGLARLIDQMPEYLATRLPGFDPDGAVRVFVQPHFGDFMHRGYIRVPFGVRAQLTDHIEANAELSSYFAHGPEPQRSGLSELNVGLKAEDLLHSADAGALGAGFNFRTPFDGAPWQFSDGHRHFQPYVAATRPILPRWRLLGFASVGANFLEHTDLPSNFGRNQLHANSVAVTAGAARAWGRAQASLTIRVAATALTSDEHHHNITVKPEVVLPLRKNANARTQVFLALGAHSIWGPNGCDTGTSVGFRVNFHLDRKHIPAAPPLAEMFFR